MPPKPQPKVYQILLRTHKLTIFFTLPPATTIASLKEEALSALTSDVNQVEDVPKVSSVDEFEICRKDKAAAYELLDDEKELKECKVSNWEILYLQFKDESGKFPLCIPTPLSLCPLLECNLLPIDVTEPSIDDDEDLQSAVPPPSEYSESETRKGKRKADD
ncbi:hypothetical protein K435DRAFT_726718 [Dendrothele bispora CBS 962.96]|uniref:Uncharacterized protein n=1 Tax=Dendrothele bispora (strain CBS 962.96) TaxID=1314807 RepID=A0A4S8LR08_DENBC|nr:hypothetical protein K435DRAFT_726718 [Dendrothele bispora CBS 962.96]